MIEAHFHGGPLAGEQRELDDHQRTFLFVDDIEGRTGHYEMLLLSACEGDCFSWWGWRDGAATV